MTNMASPILSKEKKRKLRIFRIEPKYLRGMEHGIQKYFEKIFVKIVNVFCKKPVNHMMNDPLIFKKI
jgi:hypothetical protein